MLARVIVISAEMGKEGGKVAARFSKGYENIHKLFWIGSIVLLISAIPEFPHRYFQYYYRHKPETGKDASHSSRGGDVAGWGGRGGHGSSVYGAPTPFPGLCEALAGFA